MNIFADTNIWFEIGAERLDPELIKAGGNLLIATPTTAIELASKISPNNYIDRVRAARAVITHSNKIADDPEKHMAVLFGLDTTNMEIPWIDTFKVLANISSPEDIKADGNIEYIKGSNQYFCDVNFASSWRKRSESIFPRAIEKYYPGYSSTGPQYFRGQTRKDFEAFLMTTECRIRIIDAVFERALLSAAQSIRKPSQAEYAKFDLVEYYINANIEYYRRCLTISKPKANDIWDLEFFIYLQNDNLFITHDKRLKSIAQVVCPNNLHPQS